MEPRDIDPIRRTGRVRDVKPTDGRPSASARRRSSFALAACALVAVFAAGVGCDPASMPPAVGGGTMTTPTPGGPSTPSIEASLLEQLSLERINRARLRPGAEAAAGGIAVDEGVPGRLNGSPKPPVAMNAELRRAAVGHSRDMLARNYFEHETPEGRTPFDRMTAAGYAFVTAGENLAWRGTTGALDEPQTVEMQHDDLFVDTGIDGRGHRVTMLNAAFREVGIGIVRGVFTENGRVYDSIMQTQDYGTTPAGSTFVLGVVYSDRNGNSEYDFGEGTAGSLVTLDTVSKTTNAAGGYSFEVLTPGAYTLRFTGGRTQPVTVSTGSPNIKIDLVNGARVVVNLGIGPLP